MQAVGVYAAGRAAFASLGSILVVSFSGPLTHGTAVRVRADIAAAALATGAGAAVFDFSRALVALDLRELPKTDVALSSLPAALLCSEEMLASYRAYAWEMAQHGYLRGAFTDPAAAHEWARTKVGLGLYPARRSGRKLRVP
jgi:hypothetical protein